MLEAGMMAPDFTLQDQDGKEVSLSDFRGRKVVLYFYSKDNTAGCNKPVSYTHLQRDGFWGSSLKRCLRTGCILTFQNTPLRRR